jgi:DNA polymerase-3 subunit delta
MSPVVYLFHGEDEFSIAEEIHKLEKKLDDRASAGLNTTRLDGRTLSLDELENAARAMPFMAPRRIVEVYSPLVKLDNSQALQERFCNLLGILPESTALVLVEYKSLTGDKNKKKKPSWLLEWAEQTGERAYVRNFAVTNMPGWIQKHAKENGGGFTLQAAKTLAPLVGTDTRLAHQEIVKLLTYVNYERPVESEDVAAVTALSGTTSIFYMVDALGMQNGKQAINTLHRLLEEQDAQSIFLMVVRQFRMLLLAAEILEGGGTDREVARELHLQPFIAQKISTQARRFSIDTLEGVYRRLLEIDEATKTGQMEGEVALDTFVAGFTLQ